jgi:MFS family permease
MMFFSVRESGGSEEIGGPGLSGRIVATIVDHKSVFLAAALPVIALGVLRQARQVFLPLWGDSIGLDVAQIGLVVGIATLVDTAVFYPVGIVMDRWGRKWVAVPCLAILAVGFLLLPLTSEMTGFVLVAMLTGFGNGLGAGIIQTLGADFAPEFRRGEFLGIWRLIGDTGSAVGPLVVSFVISLATLALASVVCGGIGLVGAVLMAALIPETLRLSKPDEEILREEAEPLSDTS